MHELAILEISDPRWMAFASDHESATSFHQSPWVHVVSECYGFRPHVAALIGEGGAILAGLPFVEIGRGPRRRWVSLPFTDRCSPLAIDGVASEAFVKCLEMIRKTQRLHALEIRDGISGSGWSVRAGYWHSLSLNANPDELSERFHKTRVRASLRRAEREGVIIERGRSRADLCQVFYGLHRLTRRRLGVPVQPRRFFDLLWDHVLNPGRGFVLTARLERLPIASAVFLSSNGRVIYKFSASDRAYAPVGAGNALLWEGIRQSCEARASLFDFGRTETGNEGLRAFKLGWGVTEEPLEYTVFAAKRPVEHRGRPFAAVGATIRHSPPWVAQAIGTVAYRFSA